MDRVCLDVSETLDASNEGIDELIEATKEAISETLKGMDDQPPPLWSRGSDFPSLSALCSEVYTEEQVAYGQGRRFLRAIVRKKLFAVASRKTEAERATRAKYSGGQDLFGSTAPAEVISGNGRGHAASVRERPPTVESSVFDLSVFDSSIFDPLPDSEDPDLRKKSHRKSIKKEKIPKPRPGEDIAETFKWLVFFPCHDAQGRNMRDFAQLAPVTQQVLGQRFQKEYCAENGANYNARNAKKHDLHAVMLQNSAGHVGKACVGGWVMGKKSQEGPFTMASDNRERACHPCIKGRRLCARLLEDGGHVKLCIYPFPEARREGYQPDDVGFWY